MWITSLAAVRGYKEPVQQTEWSPPTLGIAACGVFGLILAIGAVTVVPDPPGRVLAGIAAVGLLVFARLSWRARPKLAITNDGLRIRGWSRAQTLGRADIKIIRITEFRRLARPAKRRVLAELGQLLRP